MEAKRKLSDRICQRAVADVVGRAVVGREGEVGDGGDTKWQFATGSPRHPPRVGLLA